MKPTLAPQDQPCLAEPVELEKDATPSVHKLMLVDHKGLGLLFAMPKKTILLGLLFAIAATTAAHAGQIKLLQGRLRLNVPPGFEKSHEKPPKDHRYEHLASFRSRDGDKITVTYGRTKQDEANLDVILRHKVSDFTHLKEKYSEFRWITHRLTTIDGRRWTDVSFSHESKKDVHGQFYTRSVSTFVDGRLLEIWAMTSQAKSAARKSRVDQQIESIRLAP